MSDSQNLSGRGRKPGKVVGTSFRHVVASRLRERRLQLQLRAEEVAARVEMALGRSVNVQTWYHWEKGEHPFDIDAVPAIAKALEWTARELLPEETPPTLPRS